MGSRDMGGMFLVFLFYIKKRLSLGQADNRISCFASIGNYPLEFIMWFDFLFSKEALFFGLNNFE